MISGTRSKKKKQYTLAPGITLTAPIMQAALGKCDGVALAAAVSRAGGLGTFTVHKTEPGILRRKLRRIRRLTSRPVVLAFTAQWERDEVIEAALAEGFRLFQVSWWNGPRIAPMVRQAGGTILWQVGTVTQAREALGIGADVLVAQGTEAGGQVRSPNPVLRLVRELRSAVGSSVPIIAGGGFADAQDTAAVLAAGANVALFGTRFLLAEESASTNRHKARLLRATHHELHLDTQLIGDWPCAPRRRLRCDIDHAGLFAGLGIGRINTLASAATLLRILTPRRPRSEENH